MFHFLNWLGNELRVMGSMELIPSVTEGRQGNVVDKLPALHRAAKTLIKKYFFI